MIKLKKGFTLIELLVVISIIGVLSSVVLASLRSARDKAIAVKFVADFNAIAKGWRMWQSDTGSDFLNEKKYYYESASHSGLPPCSGSNSTVFSDEPRLSDTDLYVNRMGLVGWNGPYLSGSFGNEYAYDNDDDINTPIITTAGVGIAVEWCEGNGGNFLRIAPLIDKIIDGGDGGSAGKFI
ncbi:MAG: prepilin-type N-terminal cleavage/methylation domain-containing protein, partial [Patescibacteria group bacterium]